MAGLRKHGATEGQAAALVAVVELARRLAWAEIPEHYPLRRPREVASYLSLTYASQEQEVVGALFLNSRNRLLSCREIFRGTLTRAAAEPRAILKEALLAGASAIILFHTHPSCDPTPSADDLNFTLRLAASAKILGLKLEDHIILAGVERWVSLRERGRC